MKIWPTAPHMAKKTISLPTAGWARMKVRAEESSLLVEGGRLRSENIGVWTARMGERKRYVVVRKVERRFCATIICGPE